MNKNTGIRLTLIGAAAAAVSIPLLAQLLRGTNPGPCQTHAPAVAPATAPTAIALAAPVPAPTAVLVPCSVAQPASTAPAKAKALSRVMSFAFMFESSVRTFARAASARRRDIPRPKEPVHRPRNGAPHR